MNFYVMTLFPEMVMGGLNNSIIKRAMDNNLIRIEAVNIRDYTLDKHKKVDDYPFGGGAGMLMQAQPVWDCYQAVLENISTNEGKNQKPRVLYMSPQGKTFHQEMARELSKEQNLIFLCGHYEGIDQRVLDRIGAEEVSIGDYVLTGGEFPAMVMIDTISRLVPGVLNNDTSADEESFSDRNLLEYPQYTRPEEWEGEEVPEVLLSGHHKKIKEWRLQKAIENTKNKRPDLYLKYIKPDVE
ncbi:MAG: tRNA (guanosine(37)-N1)-methyltransferase TrmD [Lachnospiraceae bacterium]|nr:tRNA (guanosine(37)-N1)-methyltransferase TrmD [Lachnospiraceae bacterium]